MQARILVWDGSHNIRDLGGLLTTDGRTTCFGALVRSDTPARLTPQGWSQLYAYGIRTIITLRTHGLDEPDLNFTPPYPDLAVVQAPIEDLTDTEFVAHWVNNNLWGTPIYYQDALRRWPARHAAVISAIGQAQPGGVLFHCIRGNDRTGLISLLLLALARVTLAEIVADYELSPDPYRQELLARGNSTVPAALSAALADLDLDHYLTQAGVTPAELAAVRRRLLG